MTPTNMVPALTEPREVVNDIATREEEHGGNRGEGVLEEHGGQRRKGSEVSAVAVTACISALD